MAKRTFILKFPKKLVDQPITYHLVKKFDLKINILQAHVTPKEEGQLILGVEGSKNKIGQGLEYLQATNVDVQSLGQEVSLDPHKCVDCGYCIPLCPPKAFQLDPNTMEVTLDKDKCIACGICVNICPYHAVEIKVGP